MVQISLGDYDLLVEELFLVPRDFLPTRSKKHKMLLKKESNLLFLAKHGFVVRVARLRLFEDRFRILFKLGHKFHILWRKSRCLVPSATFGLLLRNFRTYFGLL